MRLDDSSIPQPYDLGADLWVKLEAGLYARDREGSIWLVVRSDCKRAYPWELYAGLERFSPVAYFPTLKAAKAAVDGI